MFTCLRGLRTALVVMLLCLGANLVSAADNSDKEIRRLQMEEQRRQREAHKDAIREERRDLHEQRRENAQKRFNEADKNGDRALSHEEAVQSAPRLNKKFDDVDGNRDGNLTPDEIRAFRREKMRQRRIERGDTDPRF